MLARFFVLLVFHVNLILSVTDTEQDIICTLSGEGFLNRFIANTAFYNLHSEQDVAAVTSECNNYVALKVIATTTITTTTTATTTTTTTTPEPAPASSRRRRRRWISGLFG